MNMPHVIGQAQAAPSLTSSLLWTAKGPTGLAQGLLSCDTILGERRRGCEGEPVSVVGSGFSP